MSVRFRFPPQALPETAEALRDEVRAFLKEQSPRWTLVDRAHSWMGFDRDFSKAMGAKGWIGMTWPKRYGGHERTSFERYVVLEEMLAAGAPVAAHWIGDRQSGPLLLHSGTEEQRLAYLPRVAAGEISFCIGLSEPDAGSDLASLRMRAVRTESGGWRLNGTKVWTTNAHKSDYMIALVRTAPVTEDAPRQAGLSQFIVDLTLPGITVKPITDLTGEAHFNEVHFEDVDVPDDALVGAEGKGWAQVNAELAFERSGPDRYLSAFPIVQPALDAMAQPLSREAARAVGRLAARYATMRGMSLSVAGLLQAGELPLQEAALVKDLGVTLEQETPGIVTELMPDGGGGADLTAAIDYLTQMVATFSLRGGTREIMRGMTARGLGLR